MLNTGLRADDFVSADNPYAPIVTRNVFDIHPPPPVDPNAQNAEPPPKITPNGIMSAFGHLQVLFKVAIPAKPGQPAKDQSYILSEGQAQDDIEVTKIDEKGSVVTFNNHGTVQELPLAVATASGPGAPPPGSGPGPGPNIPRAGICARGRQRRWRRRCHTFRQSFRPERRVWRAKSKNQWRHGRQRRRHRRHEWRRELWLVGWDRLDRQRFLQPVGNRPDQWRRLQPVRRGHGQHRDHQLPGGEWHDAARDSDFDCGPARGRRASGESLGRPLSTDPTRFRSGDSSIFHGGQFDHALNSARPGARTAESHDVVAFRISSGQSCPRSIGVTWWQPGARTRLSIPSPLNGERSR